MYSVLIYSKQLSPLANHVASYFKADVVFDVANVQSAMSQKRYRILVLDAVNEVQTDMSLCESLLQLDTMKNIPLMVLTSHFTLADKLKAFEIGCDDFIDSTTTGDEVCARITKSIFHRIANDQLHQRLELATETARSAMVDNSDLGANIQFLLSVHDCDNLDQLGQQFFSTIERYGLSCSLQMRSTLGIKDMEAHGMAKDLESQLLFQLKDSDRYIDFGPRTIVNYNRVSLLIKNMPLDDPEKYGAIKDNTFCLVQGLNARIVALEDRCRILAEKDDLRKLSADISSVVATLKDSYQAVMLKILAEVESASELIQHRLPHLALTDVDEQYIDSVTEQLIRKTNSIFGDGLKVDEIFERLDRAVKHSMESISQDEQDKALNGKGAISGGDKSVELF